MTLRPPRPFDPGPALLETIRRGRTPRDRVCTMLDEIQKAYAIAQTEGLESVNRWHGNYSRLKSAMLDACFIPSPPAPVAPPAAETVPPAPGEPPLV